ncbi:MAG: hypothetical protein ACRDTJ_03980, partial [Pseudonocardiaceae bacterium]
MAFLFSVLVGGGGVADGFVVAPSPVLRKAAVTLVAEGVRVGPAATGRVVGHVPSSSWMVISS